MPRTLVIIRHAKSSWAEPYQADFDRPLNERGERDAPMMGERLKAMSIVPDLIVSSTAKRAKQTAKRVAKGVGYDEEKIIWKEKLYHASPQTMEDVVASLDDAVQTVFLVSHNPGITHFANSFSPKFITDNMATCACVGVRIDIEHWADFPAAHKTVFLYEYPKKPA